MSFKQNWGQHFGEHKVRDYPLIRFQEPPRAEYRELPTVTPINVRNTVAFPVDFGRSSLRVHKTFEYNAPMAVPLQSGYRHFYGDAPGHVSDDATGYNVRSCF